MEDKSEDRGFGEVVEREEPETEPQGTDEGQLESKEQQDTEVEKTPESSETSSETTDNADNQEDVKLTEKGTKLDPNPQSAIHQQLANEKRIRTQMEQVLSDPALIQQFVKQQYGIDIPTPQKGEEAKPTTKKWTAEDFANIEDVADKFNQLQETLVSQISERDQKIQKLEGNVSQFISSVKMERLANTTESDVKSLRSEPELDPNSPDFVEGLENQIVELYQKLDFDERLGIPRGQHSLKEIGKQQIAVARQARKAGVQRGQTIVQDKTAGKIRTGTKPTPQVNPDNLSAEQSIAQGIAKMFK